MTDIAIAGTFRLADVFGTAAVMYRRRFATFIVLTVIASIPNYIVLFAASGTAQTGNFASVIANIALPLLFVVTQSLTGAAVMYGVVQELRGRAFSVAGSLLVALRRLIPVLGVAICTTAASFMGTLMLVVPGIILACMFYVSMPACIAEQTDVFQSMSRSRFLTRGYRWQVFGTLLLITITGAVFDGVVAAALEPVGEITSLVGTQAAAVIISSFAGVIDSVLYYKLRVAKEGVDIDKIASVFD